MGVKLERPGAKSLRPEAAQGAGCCVWRKQTKRFKAAQRSCRKVIKSDLHLLKGHGGAVAIIPALREAEAGGSPEVRSLRPA